METEANLFLLAKFEEAAVVFFSQKTKRRPGDGDDERSFYHDGEQEYAHGQYGPGGLLADRDHRAGI